MTSALGRGVWSDTITQFQNSSAARIPHGRLRRITFALPIALFVPAIIVSLLSPGSFLRAANLANDWILAWFGNAFAYVAFLLVLICIWTACSPLGGLRIGGAGAKPLLKRWNWFAITLNTTIATGILFWATAEPIYHLQSPGGTGFAPGSSGAERFAMASLFLHWTFTPYAIYSVAALTFALVHYNLDRPFSLSSPISVLLGRRLPRAIEQLIDALAILSLLFGLAASLGAGIMSIAGGIDRLSPLSTGPVMLACVTVAIVLTFFLSSVSGLQRGIRILSDINTRAFVVLALFVFLAAPTLDLLWLGVRGLGDYAAEFLPRSLLLGVHGNREWLDSWTVFYFANWMAWAPLTAMFLGRIARGYTVREFLFMNLVAPACFSIAWMTIFGGFALSVARDAPGSLEAVLADGGPEAVLYAVVDTLPLAAIVAALFIITSFLSYVTAADSNTDVLARISMTGDAGTDEHMGDEHEPGWRAQWLKLVWALLVGLSAWIMVTFSGIDGVKMLSNLGGLPALFIIGAFALTLVMLSTVKRGLLDPDR